MNTQYVAAQFTMALLSRIVAARVGLRIGSSSRRAVSGNGRWRLWAPLLLSGLGAAMPAQAVTQNPGTSVVVPPGTAVEYQVTASVPQGGFVQINVTNNGASINGLPTSTDGSCNWDGPAFCDGSGNYPLQWAPPSGPNNLIFTITVSNANGGIVSQVQENFSTAVGTQTLQLQVSANPASYSKVGEIITYSYQISNTGSLNLGSLTLSDSRLGAIGACSTRSVAAGAVVSCNQAYSVTQADLNAGSLVNTAQAAAPSLYDGAQITASGQVNVAAGVNPALQLQMSANPGSYTKIGEEITYTYTVSNAGNVDLSSVVVTDSKFGVISGCTAASLPAGADINCSKTYSVTQADLQAGSLNNSGQATASAPGGTAGGGTAGGNVQVVARAQVGVAAASAAPVDFTTIPNLSPNERSLAGALNSLCANSSNQTVQAQCNNLYSLNTSQIQTALQQLVPDQLAAQGANAAEISFTQFSNIRWRLGALHQNAGAKMLALSGLMLAVNDQSVPAGILADAVADDGNIANTGRLGIFVNGRVQLGDSGTTANAAGFDFTTKGVTMGVDYRFTDQLVFGGALGYANTNNDFSSGRGNMSTDGTTLSFYGTYYTPRDIYLDWIASYGGNKYDATRDIIYSGVNTQTQGDASGRQLGTSLSLGTDIARDAWLFTPYLRAEYVEAKVHSYDETGGAGFALSYDEQTVRSFLTAAAARVSKTISTRSGVYTPSVHLEWEHQYRNDQRMITARFVEDPTATPFQIATDSPDRNYFNLGVAVAATWPGGRSAFITYETVLGQDNVRNQTIDFGLRLEL